MHFLISLNLELTGFNIEIYYPKFFCDTTRFKLPIVSILFTVCFCKYINLCINTVQRLDTAVRILYLIKLYDDILL
jgi:hypothetical protein